VNPGDGERAAEVRCAARALLRHPVLDGAAEPELLRLVRRHADRLRSWFLARAGYDLVVDPAFARLVKVPPRSAPVAGAARVRPGAGFDRRRYAWLCLSLAVLEGTDGQTTLGYVAEDVETLASAHGLPVPDLDTRDDRMALADALRLLERLGVVARTAGETEDFVDGSGDALYTVRRRLAASLLAVRRPPSTVESPEALADDVIDGDAGRVEGVRHEVWRRLLETPAVLHEELSPDEVTYLQHQRRPILEELRDVCGLELEVRREGVAAVDDEHGATGFPAQGSVGHAALLVIEVLRRGRRDATAGDPTAGTVHRDALLAPVVAFVASGRCAQSYALEASGAARLLDDALTLLEEHRLVRRIVDADAVSPLPPLGRFVLDGVGPESP
jgi:uncharacterized protein (TIGR02678 family)